MGNNLIHVQIVSATYQHNLTSLHLIDHPPNYQMSSFSRNNICFTKQNSANDFNATLGRW